MRGCLSVIIIAIGVLFAMTWFAGPQAAGILVESGLAGAGFTGRGTQVRVVADPPIEVIGGLADRVEIRSSNASFGDFDAESVEITLIRVDLATGTFGRLTGRLDGVDLTAADGSSVLATSIDLDGPAKAVQATIRIAEPVVQRVALDAIRTELGTTVSAVTLGEPDVIQFSLGGLTIDGRLEVGSDGSLSVVTSVPGSPEMEMLNDEQLHLSSAFVDGDDLVLVGTIDLSELARR